MSGKYDIKVLNEYGGRLNGISSDLTLETSDQMPNIYDFMDVRR